MTTIQFTNCRLCKKGKLVSTPLTISPSGIILPNSPLPPDTLQVDVKNAIISPGFIELQINGALGFHFAHYKDHESYEAGVRTLAQYLPGTGVTAFYPTVPTVASQVFHAVLPFLKPNDGPDAAAVLGAHVEGPFLAPSKKGAHDASNMHVPANSALETVYGKPNLMQSIRQVTLAPELPGALEYIRSLTNDYEINVSMGHSAATYNEGKKGLEAGARLLTHLFNAMNGLHHREPGLAGMIT
jgi:N-acetylglucosamine-6-phosphate deacetylase